MNKKHVKSPGARIAEIMERSGIDIMKMTTEYFGELGVACIKSMVDGKLDFSITISSRHRPDNPLLMPFTPKPVSFFGVTYPIAEYVRKQERAGAGWVSLRQVRKHFSRMNRHQFQGNIDLLTGPSGPLILDHHKVGEIMGTWLKSKERNQ